MPDSPVNADGKVNHGGEERRDPAQASRRTSDTPPATRAAAAYRLSMPRPAPGERASGAVLVTPRELPTIATGTYGSAGRAIAAMNWLRTNTQPTRIASAAAECRIRAPVPRLSSP